MVGTENYLELSYRLQEKDNIFEGDLKDPISAAKSHIVRRSQRPQLRQRSKVEASDTVALLRSQ